MTIRDLTTEEYKALIDYARENGRNWKAKLQEDWYFARARGDRGATLHALRNDPRWNHEGLDAFDADAPHILTVLPEHVLSADPSLAALKWSGKVAPPAVGEAVQRLGGKVVGYVAEHGWLALWVRAGDRHGTVFGAEL
jgi:hypothetical protein